MMYSKGIFIKCFDDVSAEIRSEWESEGEREREVYRDLKNHYFSVENMLLAVSAERAQLCTTNLELRFERHEIVAGSPYTQCDSGLVRDHVPCVRTVVYSSYVPPETLLGKLFFVQCRSKSQHKVRM